MVVMFLPENRTKVLTCLRRKNSILHTKFSFMWKLENVNKTFVLIIRNKTVVYQCTCIVKFLEEERTDYFILFFQKEIFIL